jgi:subtilisin family serine protease
MKRGVGRSLVPLALAGLVLAGCAEPVIAPEESAVQIDPSFSFGSPLFSAMAGEGEARHMVVFRSESAPKDLAERVAALGGRVEAVYGAVGVAVVGGLDPEGLAALARWKDVQMVQVDATVELHPLPVEPVAAEAVGVEPAAPDAPGTAFFYARQWNLPAIGADRAWAAGRLGSPDVTVAILDTGIDYMHADLAGRVDLSRSVSFIPSDDALVAALFPGRHPVTDLQFHGTHVAATIASNALAAAGVTSKVTLIGVKVLNVNGNGPFSAILAGILYAADAGADVINMSLRGLFDKKEAPGFVSVLNRATNYAARKGVTIVVAAGNDELDIDHNGNGYVAFCDSPNVICVSATGPTASDGTDGPWYEIDAPAPYTNYGRSVIDVAAPGGGDGGVVWAACSGASLVIPVCQTGIYVVGASGTSMAAPHVAALAALLVEDYGRNPARIRAALRNTADDLGQPGNDPYYGKGRINVARALGLD